MSAAPSLFPDPEAVAAARGEPDALTQRAARKKLAEGSVLVLADICARGTEIGRRAQKLAVELRNEATLERIGELVGGMESEARILEALSRVSAQKIAAHKNRSTRVRP